MEACWSCGGLGAHDEHGGPRPLGTDGCKPCKVCGGKGKAPAWEDAPNTYEKLHSIVEFQIREIIDHCGGDRSFMPEFGDDGVNTYASELLSAIEETGIRFTEEVR